MLNRSKLAAATLVLVTFAAGGVVGSVISDAWGDSGRPQSERNRGRDEGRDGGRRRPYSERLGDALRLDAAQQESVVVILQNRQDGLSQIWGETQPRFDSLRLEIRQEISDMLTDEQQVAYQEMIARSDSARAARENRENDDVRRDGGHRHDW